MNYCRETTKMGVPPGNRGVLVPRRTRTVRRRGRHPRTPGRTAISVVAAGDSWNIRVNYLPRLNTPLLFFLTPYWHMACI